MKKIIGIFFAFVIIIALWIGRVIYFNSTLEQPVEQIYNVGEIVEYGNNFFVLSDENRNGYKIRVNSAEIIKYDDFFIKYNLKKPEPKEIIDESSLNGKTFNFTPDYIYDVDVTIFNEGNKDSGIDMFDTLLCSSNVRLRINDDAWLAMYPDLYDSTFAIKENTRLDMHFPFAVETQHEQDMVVDKDYLDNTLFYLTITQYPIKKKISIK